MLTLHPHDLVRPDATIRYWTGGDTGPTVVLLHGATLDHRAWDPQTEALAEAFRVVVPDLRGHGESDGRFDFEETVQDILALLDHGVRPRSCWSGSASAPTSPRRCCAALRTGCGPSSSPTRRATRRHVPRGRHR